MIKKSNFSIPTNIELLKNHIDIISDSYGIEIQDFVRPENLSNKEKYLECESEYEAILKKGKFCDISLHAPFFGLNIHSLDNDISKISKQKIGKAIQTAINLNASKVVIHTGYISSITTPEVVESIILKQSEYYSNLLAKFSDITICLENVWEKNHIFINRIIENVNSPRLKCCLDIGHVFAFGEDDIFSWIKNTSTHISHMHWHDNDQDGIDSHKVIGTGKIDFKLITKLVKKYNIQASILLEVFSIENYLKSVEYFEREN